jgi:hypothetical protein
MLHIAKDCPIFGSGQHRPVSTGGITMLNIETTLIHMATIAEGIRAHIFFDDMGIPANTGHDYDRAQMAISILCAFIGEEQQNELTAEQVRAFLVYCGLSQELAMRVVDNDNEPLGCY